MSTPRQPTTYQFDLFSNPHDDETAQYFNTPSSALSLSRESPRYIGGILIMLNDRLFKFWHDLPAALRSGKPQNEVKHGGKGMFEAL